MDFGNHQSPTYHFHIGEYQHVLLGLLHGLPRDCAQFSPEVVSSQQQSLARLLKVVRALPLQPRQVLTLSLEGLSYDEIAEVCGISKNHVGVILKRAKQKVLQEEPNA